MSLSWCFNTRQTPAQRASVSVRGDWVLTEQTVSPLMMIPNCKPIQKGTLFRFTDTTLEVYAGLSSKACDEFAYKITENSITFIKADMLWLCTYTMDANLLNITSTHFFTPYETDSSQKHKASPASNEIKVTLKKKTN
jgi:hypothetical protein